VSAPETARFAFQASERESLARRIAANADALRRLVIAIDGPAGSGKSTTARGVAQRLGLRHLDTGALYRAMTLAAQRAGCDLADGAALVRLVSAAGLRVECTPDGTRVHLGTEDVSEAIRAPAVSGVVSQVSAHAAVREAMLGLQQRLAAAGGTVMEGRDIGTVVLPRADVKVFLTADVAMRATRRQREEAARGEARAPALVESEIEARDRADSTRATAPLVRATDAVEVDTTSLTIEQQIDAVVALALRRVQQSVPAFPIVAEDWEQPNYRHLKRLQFRFARVAIHAVTWTWCGMRRTIHPAARLRGSVLVACNHISVLDPPIVGTALPFEVSFVAKRELFRRPLVGWILRSFNAFPIQRGTADYVALDHAVALLRAGESVIMFPEGTRQRPGRLGTPRWGFGYVARRAGRPIVPVFVRGTQDRRPRGLRRHPLEIWVGEPFTLGDVPDDAVGYTQLGNAAMQRIAGLMLRSAASKPLDGLDLPGEFADRVAPEP